MPFIPDNDPDLAELKIKLTGLVVYNIATAGNGALYPGLYIWNGTEWTTSQANPASFAITAQPKAFTFYEQGTEGADQLTFGVAGGASPHTFQWYQLVSNNVHVRVGVPVTEGTDYDKASYRPTQVLKGTTRNANNTGFYRFYCVAKDANGVELTSDVAEVAVGCGAKTKEGKWMSFMCFNLGALNTSTIASQKDYAIGSFTNDSYGVHTYITNEEDVYGDLFQWGRIADGHEDRNTTTNPGVAISGLTADSIVSGSRCQTTSDNDAPRPYYQIKKATKWYGKFIKGVGTATNYNWNPVSSVADALWRTSRFVQNDPCAHYKSTDGGSYYQEFWHEGTNNTSAGIEACTDAGTAWRIPTQSEWGELYRGGTIFGAPADAEANTWFWNKTAAKPHGFELRPDAVTTTLFLPACGYRNNANGSLYYQGSSANYWSSTVAGTNAYNLSFNNGSVNPTYSYYRSRGFAIRCIKN
jgi:uncharacterized protein (TIGR02145 family)